jgi:hypothetical protein
VFAGESHGTQSVFADESKAVSGRLVPAVTQPPLVVRRDGGEYLVEILPVVRPRLM